MRVRKKKHGAERMEACAQLWVREPEAARGKWRGLFGSDNPIHIEIGCGKGDFVTGMAALHPDINFVAVEMIADVIVTAMEKAKDMGLKNVLFANFNAERLTDVFEKGEAERIYLNFSDPWKKNRQAKRRLTHKNFLDRYKRVLNTGDFIWFKTDNKELFEFSLNSFAAEGFKMRNITFDLHNSGFEGNVMTEYEKKFAGLGQPIYRLEAEYVQ